VKEYIEIYVKYSTLDDYKDKLEEIKSYILAKKGALL